MRPKIVLMFIVCALVVTGAILVLKQHAPAPTAPAAVVTPPQKPSQTASAAPTPMPVFTPPPHVLTAEERQDAIQAEVEHLQELSRNDDPQSLSSILADLTNSEKEVREAAIEATKQFGSTNAIPALKAAAFNSTDTEEQMAMLDAANFLTLTPISDSSVQQPLTPQQLQADAQRHAQRQAQRQAQIQAMQNPGQGQNAPSTPSQTGAN